VSAVILTCKMERVETISLQLFTIVVTVIALNKEEHVEKTVRYIFLNLCFSGYINMLFFRVDRKRFS